MKLGISADGRELTYDASRYAFQLSMQPVSFDDVRALDGRDWIRWRAPELRDWFVKINRDAFIACHNAARLAIPEAGATQGAHDGAGGRNVAPDGDARSHLRYRSANPDVATVDEQGRVVVHAEGEADILAAHMQDPEFASAVRLVTIVSKLPSEIPAAEPAVESAEEPAAGRPSPSESATASAAGSATGPTAEPAARTAARPSAEPAKPAAEPAADPSRPAAKPASRTREVRARLKAENGVLATSKRFLLPELPSAMFVYEKVGGSAHIAVSAAGEVTIGAGMPSGRHSAEIAVRDVLGAAGADGRAGARADNGHHAPVGVSAPAGAPAGASAPAAASAGAPAPAPASVPSRIIISIEVKP